MITRYIEGGTFEASEWRYIAMYESTYNALLARIRELELANEVLAEKCEEHRREIGDLKIVVSIAKLAAALCEGHYCDDGCTQCVGS